MVSRKIIIGLIVFIALVFAGAGFYFLYHSQIASQVKNSDQAERVTFYIEDGWGVEEIVTQLQEKSLINSRLSFYVYLLRNGYWNKLQPGEYLLSQSSSMEEIIGILTGGSDSEIKITITEGKSIKEIDQVLQDKGLIKANQFTKAALTTNFTINYKFLKSIKVKTLEGYLFPDTYYLFPKQNHNGADFESEQLIKKMLETFNDKVYAEYGKADLPRPLISFNQLINLASIVEKESSEYSDRRLVAGVFLKRLAAENRLQACSTVNYLLSEPKEILTESDIAIESSYNTYLNDGLPPSAIGNPGLESIKATLNPKKSPYWYFLSDEDGNLYFSATAEQHQQKKNQYL